ncbi:MAG: hypothetical protein ACK48E_06865 [Holosporales bacterium]
MEMIAEIPADNHDAKSVELDVLLTNIRDLVRQVEEQKKLATQKFNELNPIKEGIVSEYSQLKNDVEAVRGQKTALQTVVEEVNALKHTAEQNRNSVQGTVDTIEQARQNFEGLRNTAQTQHDDLNTKHGEVAAKINEIKKAYEDIERQRKVLLDDQTDEQGNATKSVFNQVNEAHTNIKTLLDETKRQSEEARQKIADYQKSSEENITRFNEEQKKVYSDFISSSKNEIITLKASLEKEIRGLLPEAGAAGLSSTYFEAKARYAPTSFDGHGKSWWWKAVLHVQCYAPSIMFYAMFLVPLVIIVGIFYDLLEKLPASMTEVHWEILLFRALISLPLVTVSIFGWSSIRLYRRLYEEYNHKQRVMQLYHSFKSEVDQHGNEEHTKMLLEIMLKAVGDKPSLAMNRYDGGLNDTLFRKFNTPSHKNAGSED